MARLGYVATRTLVVCSMHAKDRLLPRYRVAGRPPSWGMRRVGGADLGGNDRQDHGQLGARGRHRGRLGRELGRRRPRHDREGRGDGTEEDPVAGTPYTLFSASIKRWFAGSGDSEIIIKQTGDESVEVEDDPLLKPGETAVLFLRDYSPGHYFIVGGPPGRFHVDGKQRLLPLPAGMVRTPGSLPSLPAALGVSR